MLNQVQVNLIYNTNRNLFLWIEIFISTTDLYNTTLPQTVFYNETFVADFSSFIVEILRKTINLGI